MRQVAMKYDHTSASSVQKESYYITKMNMQGLRHVPTLFKEMYINNKLHILMTYVEYSVEEYI